MEPSNPSIKNGVAAAALLAAGLGAAALGLITTISEFFAPLMVWLSWYPPSGSLTGQTGLALIMWLSSWALLHRRWRVREFRNFSLVILWFWLLLAVGYLGTFPPFYQLLSGR